MQNQGDVGSILGEGRVVDGRTYQVLAQTEVVKVTRRNYLALVCAEKPLCPLVQLQGLDIDRSTGYKVVIRPLQAGTQTYRTLYNVQTLATSVKKGIGKAVKKATYCKRIGFVPTQPGFGERYIIRLVKLSVGLRTNRKTLAITSRKGAPRFFFEHVAHREVVK